MGLMHPVGRSRSIIVTLFPGDVFFVMKDGIGWLPRKGISVASGVLVSGKGSELPRVEFGSLVSGFPGAGAGAGAMIGICTIKMYACGCRMGRVQMGRVELS